MINEMLSNIKTKQSVDYTLNIKKSYYQTSKNKTKNKIGLVIPVYNEEKNIPYVINKKYLQFIDEIIVIDGNSKDNTIAMTKKLLPSAKIYTQKSKGKGGAMMESLQYSSCDYLIFIDGDASMGMHEIPMFIQKIEQGFDFIKGTRFAYGGGSSDLSPVRMFGNLFFTLLTNLLYKQNFTDLCYGYFAIKRTLMNKLTLKETGFGIETELALKAVKLNAKITEVGSFEAKRKYGKSNLRTLYDGLTILKTIFKNKLFL